MEKNYPFPCHSIPNTYQPAPKDSLLEGATSYSCTRNGLLYERSPITVSFFLGKISTPVMRTLSYLVERTLNSPVILRASIILTVIGSFAFSADAQVSAVNDSYTVNSERKKWLDVYDNDTYPPGPFTVTIVSGPSNGQAKLLASGDIIYLSDNGYAGADALDYEICSGGNCDQATANISVVVEICGNGFDDDGDGLADAVDPDCINEVDIACEDKKFFDVYGSGILNQSSFTLPVSDTGNIDSILAEVTYKGGTMSNVVFSTPNETKNITSFTPIENGSSSRAVFRTYLDPATEVTVQPSDPSIAQSMMLYILRKNSLDCEGAGASLLPGYGFRSTIVRYANIPVTQETKTVNAVVPCSEISLDGRILIVEFTCAGQVAYDTVSTERDGASLTISNLTLNNVPGSADVAQVRVISPVSPSGQSIIIGSIRISATCGNDCPITAIDDTFYTNPGVPVLTTVLGNDLIPANNLDTSLTSAFTSPSNGGLVNNGDGTFTYTPNPGFQGLDSFDYVIGNIAFPVFYDTARVYIVSRPTTDTIIDTIIVNTVYDSCIEGSVYSSYGPYTLNSCQDPDSGVVVYSDTCGTGDMAVVFSGPSVTSVTNMTSNNTGGTVSTPYSVPNGGDIVSATLNIRLRGDFSNGPGGNEFANFGINGSNVATNLSTGVDGCTFASVGSSNIDITSQLQGNTSVNFNLFIGSQVNFTPGGGCTADAEIELTIDFVLPGDTFSSSPNYRVTYTPDSNFLGADTFCTITCDNFPICDTTIIVIVTEECDPTIDTINATIPVPCAGDTVTYSAVTSDVIANFQWTVPATHQIIESGGNSTYFGPAGSITVITGFASGDVCVKGFTSVGCETNTVCRPVIPSSIPGSPAQIFRK